MSQVRKIKFIEKKLLVCYSNWQETHDVRWANRAIRLMADLLQLNPRYSLRRSFQSAF